MSSSYTCSGCVKYYYRQVCLTCKHRCCGNTCEKKKPECKKKCPPQNCNCTFNDNNCCDKKDKGCTFNDSGCCDKKEKKCTINFSNCCGKCSQPYDKCGCNKVKSCGKCYKPKDKCGCIKVKKCDECYKPKDRCGCKKDRKCGGCYKPKEKCCCKNIVCGKVVESFPAQDFSRYNSDGTPDNTALTNSSYDTGDDLNNKYAQYRVATDAWVGGAPDGKITTVTLCGRKPKCFNVVFKFDTHYEGATQQCGLVKYLLVVTRICGSEVILCKYYKTTFARSSICDGFACPNSVGFGDLKFGQDRTIVSLQRVPTDCEEILGSKDYEFSVYPAEICICDSY